MCSSENPIMSQCFDRSELSDKKRPETVCRLWGPGGVCVHVDECLQEPGSWLCAHELLCVLVPVGVYLCVLYVCVHVHNHCSMSALVLSPLSQPASSLVSWLLTCPYQASPTNCCGNILNCRSVPIIPSLQIPLWLPCSLTFKFTLPDVTLESCSDPASACL